MSDAMSAFGPKRTFHMSHLMSLSGVKRTWFFALHMSACDPKRTSELMVGPTVHDQSTTGCGGR